MTDFLEEKKREINARLKELRPLVDEFHRLEAAAAALDGVSDGSAGAGAAAAGGSTGTRRRRGSAAGGGSTRSRAAGAGSGNGGGTGRRGRPRGSGTRSKQALELVRTRPGISIPEMAEEMGIQQNYLYRVLPGLQKDGLVRKEGRGWHPLEAA
jgi:CRP-like cAMP-binding protein